MVLWKCCTQHASKSENLSSGHRTGKGEFSFQSQRKTTLKNAQTTSTTQLCSSHMLVKQCSKFSKPGFNNMWTMNFKMLKLVLEKAEKPEIKLPKSAESLKKWKFQQNLYFCFIDYVKASDCVDHDKLWKTLKQSGNTRPPDLPLEKPVCWTWNNRLVPNRKMSMSRLYIVTLLI